jgi:hypothetical protein
VARATARDLPVRNARAVKIIDGYLDRWIELAGPQRIALLQPLRRELLRPVEAPADADSALAPLRSLLEMAGRGLETDRGRLDVAVLEPISERAGWTRVPNAYFTELETLHLHLVAADLFHLHGFKSYPREELMSAADDPARLWELVCDVLLVEVQVFGALPELTFAYHLRAEERLVDPRALLRNAITEVLDRDQDGPQTLPETLDHISNASGYIATLMRSLGMFGPYDPTVDDPGPLTSFGRVTAIRALQAAVESVDELFWSEPRLDPSRN